MKAGKAKKVSTLFALALKRVLGRNSPVKSTISVERSVSQVTFAGSESPAKSVASKSLAKRMPYTTSAILLPTSIVETNILGCL